jgi:hypothetical protein
MVVSGLLGVGTHSAVAGTAGAASHYSLTVARDASQAVVARWAPCVRTADGRTEPQVITYKVHTAGKPHRVQFVRRAIHRLHKATGLRFSYQGKTRYIPQQGNVQGYTEMLAAQQEQRTHVQMVIAWAFPGSGRGGSNLLTSGLEGVGSIVWRYSGDSDLRISDAAVILKRHNGLRHGFGRGETQGTLIEHELGHAVGLQHVYDPTQIMNPVINPRSPGGYAAGDRSGLKQVGAHEGCMNGPWLPAIS